MQGLGWAALHPNYPGSGKAFSPWKGPEQLCGKATHPFEVVYPDFLNVLNQVTSLSPQFPVQNPEMQMFMFLSAFIVSKSGLTGQIRGGVPDLWLCLMREPLFLGNRHHFNGIRLPATHMLYRLSIALCCVKLDVFTHKMAQPGEQVLVMAKEAAFQEGFVG